MKTLRFLVLLFILGMQALLQPAPAVSGDILYIGDNADNTIKRFDARTGDFISNTKANSDPKGVFVQSGSGGLTGHKGSLWSATTSWSSIRMSICRSPVRS